jgi:alpha-glucosidase
VFPDFTRAATREWWGRLYRELVDQGVAGIWNDMNEPAVFDTATGTMPLDVRHDNDGAPTDQREIHNVYGQLMTRGTYEGLLRLRPDERPFVLTRATYAGGQRYAAAWPGDNVSDWSAMRGAIPTLLGMGLAGLPFVGVDIGGFAENPSPELYTRWLQSGMLYPFMRTHTALGTNDQEPWSFGLPWEALNRRVIELRYELLPTIYNVLRDSSETGLPAMRPLMLEFPDDAATYGLDDQYLFGSDLLVAPVLREGASTRNVYLPKGAWFDFFTGRRFEGGASHVVPVTLSSLPLFVRAGAILFRQPVIQHTGQMAGQPLTIEVYPAARSESTLYEDDGHSLAYRTDGYLRRSVTQTRQEATATSPLQTRIEIGAGSGRYRPEARSMRVAVLWSGRPARVTVDGTPIQPVESAAAPTTTGWWLDQRGFVVVAMPDRFAPSAVITVEN